MKDKILKILKKKNPIKHKTWNTKKTSKITDGKDRNNKISNRNTNDEKNIVEVNEVMQ